LIQDDKAAEKKTEEAADKKEKEKEPDFETLQNPTRVIKPQVDQNKS
jgi:hypothetical protein